ncbi:unnamed protein product [Effrenium voratum]|nr:unnamed protein product [Effrenium voratum]
MQRGRALNRAPRLGGLVLLAVSVVLGVLPSSLTAVGAQGEPSEAQARSALDSAWAKVQQLSAQVDRERVVPKFGQKAQAILEDLEGSLGGHCDLSEAIDGALEALFLRQLLLVEEDLQSRYVHKPAEALKKADVAFGKAAQDLLRPNSTWSYESAQKDFAIELAQAMRQQVSLTQERMRSAQAERATADVVGKIQKQLDYLADKLRGTSSGPWAAWTSYRLPGTPIQVTGRYQDGRTNIMFNLLQNKDPASADAGFVESIIPGLGLSLNVGM